MLGLAAFVAVVCGGLDVTPAQAVTRTDYAVTIEGTAAYSRTDSWPTEFGAWEQQKRAAFKWRTQFSSAFIDNRVVGLTAPSTEVTAADAKMRLTVPTAEGPKTGACSGNTVNGPLEGGRLSTSLITDPAAAKEILDIRVLGSVSFTLPNCSGILAGAPQGVSVTNGDAPFPNGAFDTPFDMPHEAIGMGKVIQLLDTP